MHITLIGMSNIGKSHWAHRRLEAEQGFLRLCCDDLIEAKLAPELAKHGYRGLRDVARWMGQPYDPQYPTTSRHYMAAERDVMLDVIERLKNTTRPVAVDTTGSVIYVDSAITEQLKELSEVVYLRESKEHLSKLYERYINNPKPVIWGDAYAPQEGETSAAALKRCFPDLLKFRSARYNAMASLRVPYEQHHAANATWDKLMATARQEN